MNKSELIDAVAKQTQLSKKVCDETLTAILNTITEALTKDEKVVLVGFGTFETRKRAERKGRNPATAEELTIPASTQPVFKAGKGLKEKVNQ